MRSAIGLVTLLFGIALSAIGPVTPAPSPSDDPTASQLPIIGRTRTTAFCTTVRGTIGPTVLALLKNDGLVATGRQAVTRMADDSPQKVEIDRLYLSTVANHLAHNLDIIHGLLSDQRRFAKSNSAEENRLTQQLREKLQGLAAQQTDALHVLDGTVETIGMEQMAGDIDTQLKASLGRSQAAASGPTGIAAGESLVAVPVPIFDPMKLGTFTTRGTRRFDRIATYIGQEQAALSSLEKAITPSVVAAATACGAPSEPQPSAAP